MYDITTVPDRAEILARLDTAMSRTPAQGSERFLAAEESKSVDEGLAVLRCYVAIDDRTTRQAILDLLATVTDPQLRI